MKISVIIPTYKPQSYLWKCLESMNAQTVDKGYFEVILVLNGCKDPYLSQILNWATKHKSLNLKVIQTDLGGVSNARNKAIDIAKGEYITFVDDDDYLSPTCLQEMLDIANPETIALCNTIGFYDDGREKIIPQTIVFQESSTKGKVPYNKIRAYYSIPWAKLIHKSIIGDRRYNTNFKNGEDCLYMFLLSNRYKYVNFTSKNATYYHRYRENSAIAALSFNKAIFLNTTKLIAEYTKIYLYGSNYSFKVYLTRVLGAFHTLLNTLRN